MICVKRFANNMSPVRDTEIAKELKLPLPIVHQFLGQLVSCRLLFEVVLPNSGIGYSPAMDIGVIFLPSGYRPAIAFVLIIVMLIFKPKGIFGGE